MLVNLQHRGMRIAVLALLAVVLTASIGIFRTGWRTTQRSAENAWLTLTGRRLDLGGYRLRIDCSGQGSPAVILEAGLGYSGRTWRTVQPEIARLTRVCSYDRAGLGNSDPSPKARTGDEIVEELRLLLEKAKVKGPYVLVGHSFGGLTARIHAARYPAEVAGIVLLDPVSEDQFPHFAEQMPESERASYFKHESGGNPEGVDVLRSAELARQSDTGKVPLILVTAQSEATTTVDQKKNESWLFLQTRLAEKLRSKRHLIAKPSGHFIQNDHPDVVVGAVSELLSTIRAAGAARR
jgi:pimeloyl-ACP methyl ester carboxylesterase